MQKLLIKHLIHDINHYYKLSIDMAGVVLLARKGLKKIGVSFITSIAKTNFDYQKNVKVGRLNKFVSKSLAVGEGGGGAL